MEVQDPCSREFLSRDGVSRKGRGDAPPPSACAGAPGSRCCCRGDLSHAGETAEEEDWGGGGSGAPGPRVASKGIFRLEARSWGGSRVFLPGGKMALVERCLEGRQVQEEHAGFSAKKLVMAGAVQQLETQTLGSDRPGWSLGSVASWWSGLGPET